jgi:acyl-coenzyme A synthetase/AMP-(fatty) acid ligase
VPARWDFVAAMPRTPVGKIQKFLLQHDLLESGTLRARPKPADWRGSGTAHPA